MLAKQEEYTWKRPSLVAHKRSRLELQAGLPARRGGSKRGPSHAYHVKELRDQELQLAIQAEETYAQFVGGWHRKPPKAGVRERPKSARHP